MAKRVFFVIFFIAFLFLSDLSFSANNIIEEDFNNDSGLSQKEGTQVSNGSLTISSELNSYSENFDSYADGELPPGWTQSADNNPEWKVENQTLTYPNNDYNNARIVWDAVNVQNGEINVDIKFLGGEQLGSVMFRFQDTNNYYEVMMSSLYDFIAIKKNINGNSFNLDVVNIDLQIDTFYSLKITFSGSQIKGYLNNSLIVEANDASISSAGKVGFFRQGAGMRADNLSISSTDYNIGSCLSNSFSQSTNIKSATLSLLEGANLDLSFIFVSNNNGDSWQPISSGETIYFEKEGTQFRYKIYLQNDSNQSAIDKIKFELSLGSKETLSLTRHQDLTQLQYQENGNAKINDSFNPQYLSLYHTLNGVKIVQQPAIVKTGNQIVAYLPNSTDNTLIAFDLTNKTVLWTRSLNGFVETSPFVSNGVVYIGSYDNKLFALDQVSGEVLWTFSTDNAVSGTPIVLRDNLIFFVDYGYSGTTKFYAVDINTHQLSWSFSLPVTTFMAFTLDPQRDVLYLTAQETVYCLKTSNGEINWQTTLNNGFITKQPVVYQDKLIIGADRGLNVLNKFSGSILLSNPDNFTENESGIGATPVVKENIVYYPTKTSKKVIARNVTNGQLIWSTDVTDTAGTFSSPVLSEDGFLYLAYNSAIKVFNTQNGELVWQSSQPAWVENNPALAHGYLIFTNPAGDGTTYIYRLNKEVYSSSNGLSLPRNDQEIVSVKINGQEASSFNCSSNSLTINSSGQVEITYGSHPSGTSKPDSMVINPLDEHQIHVCYPSGQATFSYPFGGIDFVDISRDGEIISRSLWSQNGSIITITDTFSDHVYQLITPTPIPTSPPLSSGGSKAAPVPCLDSPPGKKSPWLYGAIPQSETAITLYFTDGDEPISHYSLKYGLKPGEYQFGLLNIGGKGTFTFTVSSLSPNTTYYFKIQPFNGCAPGPESNEFSATTLAKKPSSSLSSLPPTFLESKKENQEEKLPPSSSFPSSHLPIKTKKLPSFIFRIFSLFQRILKFFNPKTY